MLAYTMHEDQGKRKHSTAFGFCGLRNRFGRKELDDYLVDDDFLSFCGIKRRRGNSSEIWHIDTKNDASTLPDYLEAMLADYTLVMTPTGIDAAPAPVGMVLQLLLAETRRRVQLETDSTALPGVLTDFKGPYWGYDQVISLDSGGIAGARGNVLDCELTYALWYGDPRYLETNCVVIQSEHPIADTAGICIQDLAPVLAAMC